MPSSTVVTGAAPVWIGERLHGPRHAGTVVHAGMDAVYVRTGADVIGVTSRVATAIPCTISTRLPSLDMLGDADGPPEVGATVQLGDGAMDFGDTRVRVGRYVDFSMRPVDPGTVGTLRERLIAHTGETPQSDEIPAEVVDRLRDTPRLALVEVLGRGSGLTPFGDDVTCGIIATLLAVDHSCATDVAARALALAPDRTTWLSATLLRRAAHGDVLTAFREVVHDLGHRPDLAADAISRLRAIGHTSGAGMLLGLRLALDHVSQRSCP